MYKHIDPELCIPFTLPPAVQIIKSEMRHILETSPLLPSTRSVKPIVVGVLSILPRATSATLKVVSLWLMSRGLIFQQQCLCLLVEAIDGVDRRTDSEVKDRRETLGRQDAFAPGRCNAASVVLGRRTRDHFTLVGYEDREAHRLLCHDVPDGSRVLEIGLDAQLVYVAARHRGWQISGIVSADPGSSLGFRLRGRDCYCFTAHAASRIPDVHDLLLSYHISNANVHRFRLPASSTKARQRDVESLRG